MTHSKITAISLCLIFLVMIGHSIASSSGAPDTKGIVMPTSGNAPFTVTFTDNSTGNPTSWLWNFGDGATSDEQNTVSQTTAWNDTGTALKGLSQYQDALDACNIAITIDPDFKLALENKQLLLSEMEK